MHMAVARNGAQTFEGGRRMGKRIIYCADGTWDNTGNNTNVYKFFKALQTTAEQVPYYDDGVGADGLPLEKLAGGAFGTGLYQKIKDGYTKVAHAYEQGDQVFLIGFSRGAYTARCLAGMIAACGLPTANFTDDVVNKAFDAYRSRPQRAQILADLNKTCNLFDAQLAMVGVWDTVGALGIPAIFGGVDPILYGFLDTTLHPNVQNAYHALAIDERRCEFPATLWSAPASGQVLEQVWFAGVHCDVGGSYPDDPDGTALADITLSWMISKGAALGLDFADGIQTKYPFPIDPKYALDTKHESWNVAWTFPKRRTVGPDSSVASSVYVRSENESSYRPENLTFAGSEPAPGYQRVAVVTASKAAGSA